MVINYLPFNSLLSNIVDNRGRTCPTVDNGIPLIATNCIRNDLLYPAYEKIRYVSKTIYDTWFRGHPKPGDLIFVTKGSPGRVCMVPDPVDFCIAQDMVAIRANETKIYPKYLFALLRSPEVQNKINNMHVGTLIPHFKKGDFDKLLLPIPDRDIQIGVGDFYFSLSSKIEINRRMNVTLEATAAALFRHWFVDNPEAKGWEVKPLDQIANFLNGLALQKYPPEGDDCLPVIKIAQLRKNNSEDADKASTNIPDAYIVNDGDILFSWSGSLEVTIWCGGKGALNQHLFKVTSDGYPRWFYYHWIKHHLLEFQQIAAGKATTMGHIQRHHLTAAEVVVPSKEEMVGMNEILSPILDRIIFNNLESRTLTSLRDILLPKLMTGEIRVKVS